MERATRRQAVGVGTLTAVAAGAALLLEPAAVVDGLAGLADRPARFILALTAVYLARPFLLWPLTVLAVVVGYLYGPVIGIPAALVGTGLSSLPPFLLARHTSEEGPLGWLGAAGRRLVGTVGQRHGILAARLLPIPGDAVAYGAGLARVSTPTFVLWTIVGEIPWATVAVLTGHSMRTLSLSGLDPSPRVVVAAAGFAVLILAGPVYRHVAGSAGQ